MIENYTEQKIEINGNIINYIQKGTGQPMLFLHNGGGFWQSWKKQMDFFSTDYQVFGIDWPGFGESSAPGRPISLDLLTGTLAGFIKAKELKQVILIGNCIGASAALNYAIQHPSNVSKLILLNICPGKLIFPSGFIQKFIIKLNDRAGLKSFVSSILRFVFTKTFVKNNFPAILYGKNPDKQDSLYTKYIEKFKEQKQTSSRINLLFAVHTFTLEDILQDQRPFRNILIWGSENKVTPINTHGSFHKKLLNPEYFEAIPSGGHLCMYEQPELVNTIITRYLEQ